MSKKLQVSLLFSSIVVIAFAVVGGWGVHASSNSNSNNNDGAYSHMQVYSEVLYHIRAEYVEEPNMPVVTNGALHGLLESLDANSSYLSPTEYKIFKQKKSEGKANVGATVSKRFGYAAVVAVIPGGPSDKAGVSSGDIIEAIEGKSTHEMSLAEVKSQLMGEVGSRLNCTIIRARKIEPQKVTIIREAVSSPASQEQMLADNTGYIKPVVLTKGKAQEITNKIKSLQKQGAKKLILDLRNDADGDEEEGVAVANLFLTKGTITYLSGQKFNRVNYSADPQKKVTDLPLVVLVNRGTAGPAEVVAAAILDNARGDVLGDKTFGDGSVQKLIEVPDGSALLLSIAKYYTPNGKVIQENGITPNIQVASVDDLPPVAEDEDNPNSADEPQKTQPKEDEQLHRAIEVLKNKTQKSQG